MRKPQWWEWVVVGLALVVAAWIFMPIYAGQRPVAVQARCLSNLKQLATGFTIYSADYDDKFPNRDVWTGIIQLYTKNLEIYKCPAFEEAKDPQVYGYCFNRRLSNAALPPNPEKVELVFDSINLAKNASGTQESLPRPGRHNGKNVIAYADGHAKAVANP